MALVRAAAGEQAKGTAGRGQAVPSPRGAGQEVPAKLFWHQRALPWGGLAGRGHAGGQLGKLFGSRGLWKRLRV